MDARRTMGNERIAQSPVLEKKYEPLPITLISNRGSESQAVTDLLTARGVHFFTTYLADDEYSEPRLEVGSEELVGLSEIEALLPAILELVPHT
jgi:hypothetical protein